MVVTLAAIIVSYAKVPQESETCMQLLARVLL